MRRSVASTPTAETWEFHDTRQPNEDFAGIKLVANGTEMQLGDARFVAARHEHSVDVSVFHPAFAGMPEQARLHLAYMFLDWALDEYAVEVWVGAIGAAIAPAPEQDTVDRLRATVTALAGEHDTAQWAILRGTRDRRPAIATGQLPRRPARWARFDTHVEVVLPLDAQDNGLPTDAALSALRSFEDSLDPLLGADGALLAHQSGNGIRTLHYYVDGRSDLPARLAAAVPQWPRGRSRATHDPELAAIRHLRA